MLQIKLSASAAHTDQALLLQDEGGGSFTGVDDLAGAFLKVCFFFKA